MVLNFYIHLLSQQLPDIDIWILTHISLNLAPVPLQATKDKRQARQKRQRQRQKASEGQNSRFSHLDHTDTHTIYVHEHKKAQFFVAFKNSHKLILFIFSASTRMGIFTIQREIIKGGPCQQVQASSLDLPIMPKIPCCVLVLMVILFLFGTREDIFEEKHIHST